MALASTIPFREWVRCAQNCSGDRGSGGVSWDYLTASIKIAASLSDQLSNAEDLACMGISDSLNILPPRTSRGGLSDWAEFVTVSLKDVNDTNVEERGCERRRSSLPIEPIRLSASAAAPRCSSISAIGGGELQALLDDFVQDYDRRLAEPSFETGAAFADEEKQARAKLSYLNVHSAEISDPGKAGVDGGNDMQPESVRIKQQRIYFLGLIFYELFSGGERPPPQLLISPSSLIEPDDTTAAAQNASRFKEDFDFTRSLNLLDDIIVDDKCEFFDDLDNGNGVLECKEGPMEDWNESFNDYGSRKRQSILRRQSEYSRHSEFSGKGVVLCRLSAETCIEQLKLKGLPGKLCDLILAMIDAINMDLSGEESYRNIADVSQDLALMLESPNKYLQDLNIELVSLSGLEINETVFVRNNEFACLQSSYWRSASGSLECALVSGDSGTGKSWLADRLGRYVSSDGGYFLSGKFDRLHQDQPYSVLASAFNKYCDMLIQDEDCDRARLIASKLQESLGRDGGYQLSKVLPSLNDIIVCEVYDKNSDRDQCMDAHRRLCYLMCRFVETISRYSGGVITLLLDDVQWADDVSISVVKEILSSTETSRFFFLGCYRGDEMGRDHPFRNMIEGVRGLGVNPSIIELQCMDRRTVNRMVSHILCLSPRLVRSLSDIIYHKTKGNPLFFSQLILSLNKDGLLRLSLCRRRWEWDEERIQAMALPDNVAVLFTNSMKKLPADVRMALCTLSCFGATIEIDVIKELETKVGSSLMDPLSTAEQEGFVRKFNAKFQFSHDRIHEAAYGMIPVEERCIFHLNYGLSLAENEKWLFPAVGQLNLAGPASVSNDEHRVKIARYNIQAGRQAMEIAEFVSAFSFFDNAISFLKGKTLWKDHYELALELHELAAHCAVINDDLFSLTILSDQVMKYKRCFADTLTISYTCMTTLGYASKIVSSVQMGLDIVAQLGEELPRSFSDADTELRIQETKAMLDEISLVDLQNYRAMTDKKKIYAMKFLRCLEPVVQQVDPNLQPVVTIRMVELTIAYGMSPMSPIGFAYFGCLVAHLGDIHGGSRYTSLANSLVDQMQLNEIVGQVSWVANQLTCFLEPLGAANVHHMIGEAAALAAGDITWACFHRLFYAGVVVWSGAKLALCSEVCTQASRFMKSKGHTIYENYALATVRSLSILVGAHQSQIITDEDLKQRCLCNNNPLLMTIYHFQKVFLDFILDDQSMKENADEYFNSFVKSWILMSAHVNHAYIMGLVSFRLYRETNIVMWLERGKRFSSIMKLWSEQGSPWNFESKISLLQAEEHYCNDTLDEAKASYDTAISSANGHKLMNEEAIGCELAARFHFDIGDLSTSLKYYTAAHAKYQDWGAVFKVHRLYEDIREKFSTVLGAQLAVSIPFDDFDQGSGSDQQRFNREADERKRRPPQL